MEDYSGFDEQRELDFYRRLRKRMMNWQERKGKDHKWADYLVLAPDLFYTLIKLMGDDEVSSDKKVKIAATMAYFISPLDLIPETFLGPVGFIDDVALAALVLKDVMNNTSPEVVRRHWPGQDDVLEVIQRVLDQASNLMGAKFFAKLRRRSKP